MPGNDKKGKVPRPPRYTEEYLLEHLQILARHLGRRPVEYDLINWRREHGSGPSASPYSTAFAGLPDAREKAGIDDLLANLRGEAKRKK